MTVWQLMKKAAVMAGMKTIASQCNAPCGIWHGKFSCVTPLGLATRSHNCY
jgi:hypothetical protein